jgi:hypothetical protein
MMRALNFVLVSSGFVAIFFGIAFISAMLTATVFQQLHSPRTPPLSLMN